MDVIPKESKNYHILSHIVRHQYLYEAQIKGKRGLKQDFLSILYSYSSLLLVPVIVVAKTGQINWRNKLVNHARI